MGHRQPRMSENGADRRRQASNSETDSCETIKIPRHKPHTNRFCSYQTRYPALRRPPTPRSTSDSCETGFGGAFNTVLQGFRSYQTCYRCSRAKINGDTACFAS